MRTADGFWLRQFKRGTPEAQAAVKEVRKKHRLGVVALEQLHFCRHQLDRQPGGRERWLIDVVDGGYPNRTFLRGLAERTHMVACYSMLLWSSMGVFGDRRTAEFESLPAWRNLKPARPSTRDLIQLLQRQAAEANLNPMRN